MATIEIMLDEEECDLIMECLRASEFEYGGEDCGALMVRIRMLRHHPAARAPHPRQAAYNAAYGLGGKVSDLCLSSASEAPTTFPEAWKKILEHLPPIKALDACIRGFSDAQHQAGLL